MRASSMGPGVTPEGLFGLRPVGLEELVLDAGELAGHDGPADRVEVPAQEVHPLQALGQIDVTPGPAGQVGLFGPVGIGHLDEVGGGVGKARERKLRGRLEQGRLTTRKKASGSAGPAALAASTNTSTWAGAMSPLANASATKGMEERAAPRRSCFATSPRGR